MEGVRAVFCPTCQSSCRRFGRNRNGSQRYRCDTCSRTFTDEGTRPRDRRQLSPAKAILALRHLLEGSSIRSTERLVEVHRDTIMHVMVRAGRACERFLERTMRRVDVADVQADEIWGFVGCKERTRERRGYGPEVGDAWCFVALERASKLVLTWHLGKRSPDDTLEFADKLRRATHGRFQLSTDGFRPYRTAIREAFGPTVDYAQLVKVYSTPREDGPQARYSPGEVVETYAVVIIGRPDQDRICTSHAERANLTIRMTIRRMTRLTNAHSKKWANHGAAFGLYFAFYNFCRPHQTLTEATWTGDGPPVKTTPAMAAGLTDHVWTVAELLQNAKV
jgi:transposase-like protein/IS1 family transposase